MLEQNKELLNFSLNACTVFVIYKLHVIKAKSSIKISAQKFSSTTNIKFQNSLSPAILDRSCFKISNNNRSKSLEDPF